MENKIQSKIILTIVLTSLLILLTNIYLVSAFGEKAKFDKDKNEITITDLYGFGSDTITYKLLESQDSIINAYAIGTSTLYKDGIMFENLKFYDKTGKEQKINYKIYYYTNEVVEVQEPVYKEVCEKIKDSLNKSEICSNVLDKYKTNFVIQEVQHDYNFETLKKGNYKWKIDAQKQKINQAIDWIFTSGSDFGSIELRQWQWWDGTWQKRKKISVGELSGENLYNFTIYINVTYDSDMQADFQDIRFASNDASPVELFYWNETAFTSGSALFWVKVPLVTANANTSIYMYYGKSGVVSTANITQAFLIGDDFEDGSFTDRWSGDTAQFMESHGTLKQNGNDGGINGLVLNGVNYNHSKAIYEVAMGQGRTADGWMAFTVHSNSAANAYYMFGAGYAGQGVFIQKDFGNYLAFTGDAPSLYTVNVTYRWRAIYNETTRNVTTLFNGLTVMNETDTSYRSGYVGVIGYRLGQYWDWVGVRNYTTIEPHLILGAEESGQETALTLNKPIPYFNSSIAQVQFNCTANTTSSGMINLTLIINGVNNYTVYNTTDSQASLSLQTNLTLDDGNYTWDCNGTTQNNVAVANSSNARNLSVRVYPNIFIYFPQNLTYNYFVDVLNFSAIDTHLESCWFSNNNGYTNVSISCTQNITTLSSIEGSNNWTIYANDTFGNTNSSNVTFYIDLFPQINYGVGTPANGANLSQNYIFVNITYSDPNFANITFTLRNLSSCYQESANVTNQNGDDGNCNLNYSGSYGIGSNGIFYINYTKPNSLLNNFASWRLKYGFISNTTLIPNDCFNYDSNKLILRINSYYQVGEGFEYKYAYPQCFNGTWKNFTTISTIDSMGGLGDNADNLTYKLYDGNWSTGEYYHANYPGWNSNPEITKNYTMIYEEAIIWGVAEIITNSTVYTVPTYTINWSGLPDNDYTYFVNITDLNNNMNSTEVRRIRLDRNAPSANISTPVNNTITDSLIINFTVNISDNLGIQNATLFINNQSGLYNQTSVDIGTLQSTVGIVVNVVSGIYKWWYQVWDWAGNNFTSSNYTLTIYNKPTINSITVTTTGGATGTEFLFNQIVNNITINIFNGDNNQILAANLTVTDPDGIKIVNNTKVNNITYSVWYYNTPFAFNKAGTWSFNVSTFDIYNNSNSTTLNVFVSTLNISTTASWYGYTNDSILTDAEIINKALYLYNLYEIRANASKIDTYYTDVLNSINKTSIQDIKVGLNYYLDFNISDTGERGNFTANITSLFPTLLLTPYYGAMAYISLEVHNPSQYTDAELYTNINSIAQTITQATNNKFVIFSKNYNSTNLNAMYIIHTSLLYLEPVDEADWINKEANLSRTYSSINRVYVSVPTDALSAQIHSFHGILSDLRTPFNTVTIHSDMLLSSTTNGDLIVFNNLSTAINQLFNFTNITTSGKDFYDTVHQYVIISNSTNRTFNVIVEGYNATLIFADDIGQIEMTSNKTATVYLTSGTGSNSKESNWTDGTMDDNFALYGANDIRIELYDPFYIQANFMTYYGWLNASYVNFTVTNYSVLIIADKNAGEIAKIKGVSSGNVYGYVSVADYTNTNEWNAAKELEVDGWIASNESINLFLDGLDIGLSGVNFSSRFKNLIDYTRITKGKKAILNTYTAYEEYATWGDGIMKESCVQRWNGPSAGSVTSYTREDWDLEVTRARWFKSHGIPVYCQSFGNRTTNPIQIENYTDLINIYYASKVLGYDYFYLTQPDFGYAYQLFVPDLGISMSNDFFTEDNEVYYRRYSNGIVYYNSTSGQGRFDNGRTVTGAQACFNLYDAFAGGVSFDFYVNKNPDSPPATGDYSIPDTEMTLFGWKRVCRDINVSNSGRYVIDGFANPRSTIVGQGLNIGAEIVDQYNQHSWYDTTAGAYVWAPYGMGKNWEIYLTINQTVKSALDTLTNIIQTDSNSTIYRYNLTLSSFYHQDAKVYSYLQTINAPDTFKSIKYNNGTDKIILNTTNSSACITLEPVFNLSVINGETFGSCYYNYGGVGNKIEWRVMVPSLSNREFELELTDAVVPAAVLFTPANNTYWNTAQNYTVNLSDAGGISNATLYIYNTTSGDLVNQTFINVPTNPLSITVGIVVSLVDGIYHWLYSVLDISNNLAYSGNNTITIDTVNPVLIIKYPTNKTYNSSEVPTTLNYTYTEINPQACWYSVDNGITNISSICGNNITALTPNQGINTWMIKMQDNASNVNQSYISFFVDSINPKIYFSNPTEISGAFLKRENAQINVTVSDTNDMDVSIKVYNSSHSQVGASSWVSVVSNSFYYNFTASYDGIHYFNATVTDAFGNYNYTETRNVTIDRIYPSIEYGDGTAENYANLSQLNVFINTTWTEVNPANITFWVDGVSHLNNIVPPASPVYSDNFTGLTEGVHTYYAIICDSANNCNQTATRTITLHILSPNAVLLTPANNTYHNTDQNYTASLTDTLGIKNATLFIYNDSGLINETSFIDFGPGILLRTVGVVVSLADGTYKWFYTVYDVTGNVFTTNNNTVNIDTSSPRINFNNPANNSYSTNISYNISSSGANLKNITIYVYNTSGLWNSSFINYSLGTTYGELTGNFYPSDGIYDINATSCIITSKCNSTETRRVTIDNVYPTITWSTPTLLTGSYNITSIWMNVTAYDTNLKSIHVRLELLIGGTPYLNSSYVNTTLSNESYFYNFTNLNQGNYTMSSWAIDKAGLITYNNNISVIVDNTPPIMNYSSPTPDNVTSITANYFSVNVSVVDVNLDTITINLRSPSDVVTSYRYTPGGGAVSASFYKTFSALGGGIYTYNATANDSQGNVAWLSNRTIDIQYYNISVTTCRDLAISGGSYILLNSVTNLTGTCINVTGTDVKLNCNGFTVTGNYSILVNKPGFYMRDCTVTAPSSTALYVKGNSPASVTLYNSIFTGSDYGIYMAPESSLSANLITVTNNVYGIYFNNSSNGNLINNSIFSGNSEDTLTFINTSYNKVYSMSMTSAGDTSNNGVIRMVISTDNLFEGCTLTTTATKLFDLSDYSVNNLMSSCTYTSSKDSVDGTSHLIRQWEFTGHVIDYAKNPIDKAIISYTATFPTNQVVKYKYINISVKNITYTTIGSSTSTDDKGYAYTNIIEYVDVFGINYPSTPYEFRAALSPFRPVNATIAITIDKGYTFQLPDEITSTPLSRVAMWLLLGIIYLIGLAASVGFFMVRMREGYSVVDIWKYFIIFVIWFVMFTVIYYVLSVYVMATVYPKI